MNQSISKVRWNTSLALVLTLPQHVVSFTSPMHQCNPLVSSSPCTRTNAGQSLGLQQHASTKLHNASPLSLDAIMENDNLFPNTSRILRALSQDNTGDYKEFLTALSQEWIEYSAQNEAANDNWIKCNIGQSSPKIATAVGTVSGYATVQGLDYMHHYDTLANNFQAHDSFGDQHVTSADLSYYNAGGYEPNPYMAQDYHYGDSSPNLLRDLANSLPPPDELLNMESIFYDESVSYHDDSLYYVASSGMDVAVANVHDVSEAVMSSTSPVQGNSLTNTIQDTASDAATSLSSQLSEIPYSQSFNHAGSAAKRISISPFSKSPGMDSIPNTNEGISKVKEFAIHSTDTINHALAEAKVTGSSQLNDVFGSMSHSFEGLPDKIGGIGSSSAKMIGKAVGEFEQVKVPSFDMSKMPTFDASIMRRFDISKVKIAPIPPMPSVDMSTVKASNVAPAESLVVENNHAAPVTHLHLADTSLADIGNSILKGIQFLGGIFLQFFDWITEAVTGTNLSQIVGSVQISISALIDNASSSVVSLFTDLGDVTLKEILKTLLTLILVVTDMILKVGNAVIYLISGKDADDWVLQANSAMHTHGGQLLAQAGVTYQDITHRSLGELANSIGDYSHHVGEELLSMMNSYSIHSGVENVLSGNGGDMSYLSAENLDTIASAVQTALTL